MMRLVLFALAAGITACGKDAKTDGSSLVARPSSPQPDELPVLINTDLPFRYPAALYARKVQGNVTLSLYIDQDGRVIADSTRVEEPSGYPALDSAAITGARDLRFVPAKLHGDAMPVSVLFPVYFRHPEASPLPGDSILKSGKSE